jgi:hypothetical protein
MEIIPVKITERINEGNSIVHLVFNVGNRDCYVFEKHGDLETELKYIRKGSIVKIGIEDHKIVHLGI